MADQCMTLTDKLAVSELNASNLAILARDRRLEIDGLVAKLAASESECASWRKVLADERAHAQLRLAELRERLAEVERELCPCCARELREHRGEDFRTWPGLKQQLTEAQATIARLEEQILNCETVLQTHGGLTAELENYRSIAEREGATLAVSELTLAHREIKRLREELKHGPEGF